MRILIVGKGGREHALAWRLRQDAETEALFVAPGNPGTATLAENVAIGESDAGALIDFCRSQEIDLVVIGPEEPLVNGLADDLRQAGLTVFGPSKAAAQIEGSKAAAKEVMERAGVPTAQAQLCITPAQAWAAVEAMGCPVVIKADGLAAGKGVTVAKTTEAAQQAIDAALVERRFGEAGNQILVERYVEGPEFSAFALTDGQRFIAFPFSMDHKALLEDDRGPNTGGMGAICPAAFVPAEGYRAVMTHVFTPTLRALADEGRPFVGLLYAGLKWTKQGPVVLEFNARFGDPETQALLPLVQGSLATALYSAATGALQTHAISFASTASCCIVAASEGYPAAPRLGDRIEGLASLSEDLLLFQAGTRVEGGSLYTASGRVFSVVAVRPTLLEAVAAAYQGIRTLSFRGMQYRKDIGAQALRWALQQR